MTLLGAKELKARLSAHPTGAYLFFGEEEFLKRLYLSRFRALITENAEFNVSTLEVGEERPVAQIAAEMAQLPFLSDLRFLEVRGLALHRLSDGEGEELCRLLADCPEDLILILYFFECDLPFSGTIPGTKKQLKDLPVYQNLPEGVSVVRFTHPTAKELFVYYDAKLKSRGVKADRAVLELFCARGKGNMTLLENESEKLISLSLAGDGTLTREMVEEALPELSETMIYKLSDAIESCDTRRALEEYETLRNMKFMPIPLFASIARAVANLAIVKSGVGEQEAEKQFGLKPFRVKTLRARAKNVSDLALAEAQAACSETDRKLKNTGIDEDLLLQTLIVTVCHTLGGKA